MSLKKIISIGLLTLILILFACFESEGPSDKPPVSNAQSFGTFNIKIIPEDVEAGDPAYTTIVGSMCDGPSPPEIIFKEVMTSGSCKLMKAVSPFCSENCVLGSKCVAEDSCMPEPKVISVGNVTVKGMINKGEKTAFTMEPDEYFNYQMVNVPLDYPPFSTGDTITLSAAGSGSAGAFEIKVLGITPLVVLSDTLELADGKDITIKWEPPAKSGVSKIYVRMNISYHGGTKGEIQCEAEDNGSLTIPGAMLDKLKSYGFAGWPCVYITRRSTGIDEVSKAKAVVECTITKLLTIPGLKSCNNQPGECPEGQTCVDRRCQ